MSVQHTSCIRGTGLGECIRRGERGIKTWNNTKEGRGASKRRRLTEKEETGKGNTWNKGVIVCKGKSCHKRRKL